MHQTIRLADFKSLAPICKNLKKWLFLPVISSENPSITEFLTQYFESHLNALKICNGLRHPD